MILISSLLDPPGSSVGGRDVKGVGEVVTGSSEGFTKGILLVVRLARGSWGGVQAPPGLQRNFLLSWCGELENAGLFGNNCALVLGGKLGHQLGDKLANLLWVQVTMLLRHINKRGEDLIVALLNSFLENTTGSTDLNRELLTTGVSNKLARLLLHILGCAGGLEHSLANLWTLTIANFLYWSITLPHCLIERLLFKCDGAFLLKVFITHFLWHGAKFGNIGVVALLRVLVCALQDRLLLQAGHRLLLVDTAQPGLWFGLTACEVNTSRGLSPTPLQGFSSAHELWEGYVHQETEKESMPLKYSMKKISH